MDIDNILIKIPKEIKNNVIKSYDLINILKNKV